MKWSELPQEYKDLEKGFHKDNDMSTSDEIAQKFFWNKTPQGYDFWGACDEAKTIDELPKIPTP
jgi:hypothetical protein